MDEFVANIFVLATGVSRDEFKSDERDWAKKLMGCQALGSKASKGPQEPTLD